MTNFQKHWGIQMNAPCKDCPERYLGCHQNCEKYQDYRKKQTEFNEKVRGYKEDDSVWRRKVRTKWLRKRKHQQQR